METKNEDVVIEVKKVLPSFSISFANEPLHIHTYDTFTRVFPFCD